LTIAGLSLEDESDQISLYPNPANDMVTISGIITPVTLEICNSGGEIVKTMIVEKGSFNVGELPKGIYLIKINNGSELTVKKLVVE
jgi:hypothetical protein